MAEISLDDPGISRNLGRTALRNDAAFRQNENVFGQTHHRLHHMLDHDDGHAARAQRADDGHDFVDFGWIQSGEHFVEQQELRLRGKRTGELETFSAGDRQGICRLMKQVAREVIDGTLTP